MSKLYFKEVQRYPKAWIWTMNILIFAVVVYEFLIVFVLNKPASGQKEDHIFLLFMLVPVGLIILFNSIRMETEIRRDGICFRFFPFIRKFKMIRWEEIQRCYVRTYRPIAEYGGRGIRAGWKRKSMAYNIQGRTGLQIELKNGRRILLGTQKGKEVEGIIKNVETNILNKSYEG
jgi:hypothetical protein